MNDVKVRLETATVFFWFLVDGFWLMEWKIPAYVCSAISIVFAVALFWCIEGELKVMAVAFADWSWLLCNVAWAVGDLEKYPPSIFGAKLLFGVGLIACGVAFFASGGHELILRRLRLLNWLSERNLR